MRLCAGGRGPQRRPHGPGQDGARGLGGGDQPVQNVKGQPDYLAVVSPAALLPALLKFNIEFLLKVIKLLVLSSILSSRFVQLAWKISSYRIISSPEGYLVCFPSSPEGYQIIKLVFPAGLTNLRLSFCFSQIF